ncbi:MAG: hypothetical protein ABSH28_12425, partial [Acidobacteriota bacterium]
SVVNGNFRWPGLLIPHLGEAFAIFFYKKGTLVPVKTMPYFHGRSLLDRADLNQPHPKNGAIVVMNQQPFVTFPVRSVSPENHTMDVMGCLPFLLFYGLLPA